jgi:hypothetical protein
MNIQYISSELHTIPEQNTGRSPKAIFILWIPLLKSWVKK